MDSAIVPANEAQRLEAILRYDILDTPPDGAFDRIAALAARWFRVPIATVTIVDRDRIWFKAREGIDVHEIDRDPGLCASAILQDEPYVVVDAARDPRTLDNPHVRGELRLRFYAAAPIKTVDGHNLGTINVIGREPRDVTPAERQTLKDLAAIVADELELRLAARRAVELERAQKLEAERLTSVLQRRLLPQGTPEVPGVELATYYPPA
jgi:phosphoserine phosphatase RsbU/P